jgi:hypothetical protein
MFHFYSLFFLRLVRGSGEIIEEIVSRERHQAINKVNKSETVSLFVLVTLLYFHTTILLFLLPSRSQQATRGDGAFFNAVMMGRAV